MKLGLNLGYWGAGIDADNLALAEEADRLGFSVVWAAEAYGSDVVSVLAWVGARTRHVDLGAAVMQIPARSPAMTAMTAATLDSLSGGRFRLGLGVSGPQVSEGWHGVRFDQPLARTREYVDIVRLALGRQRVRYAGQHYQLPLPDGPGKALTLTVHPIREHIPLYLASVGPKNLELTGQLADGWLGLFFSPENSADAVEHLRAGMAAAGRAEAAMDIAVTTPLVVGDDPVAAAEPVRPYCALYIGGMGSRQQNFYNQLAVRMGFGAAAQEIQDRYLSRDYAGAAAAVPMQFVDGTSLLGPVERIADRMQAFAAAGVTTLSLTPHGKTVEERAAALRSAVAAVERAGLAEPSEVPA